MTTRATGASSPAVNSQVINEKLKAHVGGNWLHNFTIDENRKLLAADPLTYRTRILEPVFASLFFDRSVLVLDEASGIYPALVSRAGAHTVSASSPSHRTCELIKEVTGYGGTPTDVVQSKMIAFHEDEPYVDMAHGDSHDFLLALGQVWPMFQAANEDFDAVVEACTFFVTSGLVFDWTNAEWATPPPPDHYSIEGFYDALRSKFEHVICFDNWLVVATMKLPAGVDEGLDAPESERAQRRPLLEDPKKAAYRRFVPRFRESVSRTLPPSATVAVVSRGDGALLNLDGRTGWHFPQAPNGDYAGHHPADSRAAIEHLEGLRARGCEFLTFAEPSMWWLDHYVDFHDHLRRRYPIVVRDDETCIIFDLRARAER